MRKAPQRQSGLIRKTSNVCSQKGIHLDAGNAAPKASRKDDLDACFPSDESYDESEISSRSNSRRESFRRISSPRNVLRKRKVPQFGRRSGILLNTNNPVQGSRKDAINDFFSVLESDDDSNVSTLSNSRRETFRRSPPKAVENRTRLQIGRRNRREIITSKAFGKNCSGKRDDYDDDFDEYFSHYEIDDTTSALFVDDSRSSHAGSSKSRSGRQALNQVSNQSKAESSLVNINSSLAHKSLKSPSHPIFIRTPLGIETAGVPDTAKASNKDVPRNEDKQAVVERESPPINIEVGQSSVASALVTISVPLNASSNMSYSQLSKVRTRLSFPSPVTLPEFHKITPTKRPALHESRNTSSLSSPALTNANPVDDLDIEYSFDDFRLNLSRKPTRADRVVEREAHSGSSANSQKTISENFNATPTKTRKTCIDDPNASVTSRRSTPKYKEATNYSIESDITLKNSVDSLDISYKLVDAAVTNTNGNSAESLNTSSVHVRETEPATNTIIVSRRPVGHPKKKNDNDMNDTEEFDADLPPKTQPPGRYTSVIDHSHTSRPHSLSASPDRGNVTDRNDTRKSKNTSSLREEKYLIKTSAISKRLVGRARKNRSVRIEEADDTDADTEEFDADLSPKTQLPGRYTSVIDHSHTSRPHSLSASPDRGNVTDRNDTRKSKNTSSLREEKYLIKTSAVSKRLVGRPRKNRSVRIEEADDTDADSLPKAQSTGLYTSVQDFAHSLRAHSSSASPKQHVNFADRNHTPKSKNSSSIREKVSVTKTNRVEHPRKNTTFRIEETDDRGRNMSARDYSNAALARSLSISPEQRKNLTDRNDMSKSKNTSSVREKKSASKTNNVSKMPVGRPRKMGTSEISDVSRKPNERPKRKLIDDMEEMEEFDVDLSRSPIRYTSMVDYAHSLQTHSMPHSASFDKSETVADGNDSQLKSKNTSLTQKKKPVMKTVQKVRTKYVDRPKTVRTTTTVIKEPDDSNDDRPTSIAQDHVHFSRAVSTSREKLQNIKDLSGAQKSITSTIHFELNSMLQTQSATTPRRESPIMTQPSSVHKSIQTDWEIESEEELVIDELHSSLHQEIRSTVVVPSSSLKVASASRVDSDSNLLLNGTSSDATEGRIGPKWKKLSRPSEDPLLFETLSDEESSSTLWGRSSGPDSLNDFSLKKKLSGKESSMKEKERKTKTEEMKEARAKERKKKDEKKEKKREKTTVKRTREDFEDDVFRDTSEEGVVESHARPKRHRIKPLEFWRNERPIYRLNSKGCQSFVEIDCGFDPNVYEYKRLPNYVKEYKYSKNQLDDSDDTDSRSQIDQAALGEDGFKQKENQGVIVINPHSGEEVMIDCVKVKESHFAFSVTGEIATPDDDIILTKPLRQKAFSAGTIEIKAKTAKGLHNLKNDTMVFYVTRGYLEVTIHETMLIAKKGDLFFIPQGNKYNLCNNTDSSTTLVFFQLKND